MPSVDKEIVPHEGNPSQKTANEVVRVLSGRRRKLTCTVHLPNGGHIEFQADKEPQVQWHEPDRAMWLMMRVGDYSWVTIMRSPDGAILLVEPNEG